MDSKVYEALIIGGGQAGLSVAYFLKRHTPDFIILDQQEMPGGSWQQTWDSLKLFSPIAYNSLSGWQMPGPRNQYPGKEAFINYLKAYEERYQFPVRRAVKAVKVERAKDLFKITTDHGVYHSKTLISATGKAGNPFIPYYPKATVFQGKQIHSVQYRNAAPYKNQKVLIIGGGNSGAQILAEISMVAETKWITLDKPVILPEYMDGHYLFEQATKRYLNKSTEKLNQGSLGDIIQIDSVKEALQRNVYKDFRPFESFYKNGIVLKDGTKEAFDQVVWCTGFKPDLRHLRPFIKTSHIKTKLTKAIDIPGLWLVGYGSFTGFASDTIYGVGKTAKQTGKEVKEYLQKLNEH